MSLATARSVLLWCMLINLGGLTLWGLLIVLPHGWLHRPAGRLNGPA